MPITEDLQKELYAGASPDIKYGDTSGTGLEVQNQEAPERKPWDFSGRKSPGMFDLKYGKPEDEELDLDWIYSPGALKIEHVQKFVHFNTEENERFAKETIVPQEQGILEELRPPTVLEWTEASEQSRTTMRRGYIRESTKAVENISKMLQGYKSAFDTGVRVLANEGVKKFRDMQNKRDNIPFKDALASTISKVEGTDDTVQGYGYGTGYDVTLGYGKYDPEWFNSKEQSLADLTVQEVIKLQGDILKHPENNFNSSAVGKWQLTRRTLRDLMDRKVVDIKATDKFTPELQDKIFTALLERRGYSDYKSGKLSKDDFLKNLKKEWEGLSRFSSDINDILDTTERLA